jgi:hypothetical protein
LRSSVPLQHKLIAVAVAAATASGLYAFLLYREAELAFAASLSFDSAVAQELDPGFSRTPQPAVVLGQSILSDSVVARLVSQTNLAASPSAQAIGEFRNRVELTQPSAGLLQVRYLDPDPGKAIATANAVAKAFAEWAPSTAGAPAPGANTQPAPAPDPNLAPPSAATPQHSAAAEPSLAAALGELQAQLSAADQQAGPESSLLSEHQRQRRLESQVHAAQQKLDDMRTQFAHSGSASSAQARLDAIQHALALFWPSAGGLDTAGTSEAQLDYERKQLTRDIGVIKQQQAAQRGVAASSASVNPPSQLAAPLGSQPQPAQAADVTSPHAFGAALNPLRLDRLAGSPAPVVWWPSALIGCSCGLLYWGLAFACYCFARESDDLLDRPEVSARSANRLLNIDAAVPSDSRAKWIEASPVEASFPGRAHTTSDPDSIAAAPLDPSPSPEPIEGSTADTVPDSLPETANVPTLTVMAQAVLTADAVAPPRTPREQEKMFHDKIVEMDDHWAEEIRKNLLQTTVARMFNPQIAAEDVAAKGPARAMVQPPSEADHRLPGSADR